MTLENQLDVVVEITGLGQLERELNRAPEAVERALKKSAEDVRFAWKVWTIAVGAVDTRAFVQSIGEHRISAYEWVVDTRNNDLVIYSDIVERGRKDAPSYPARYPAEKALDALDAKNWINDNFEKEFDRTFKGN